MYWVAYKFIPGMKWRLRLFHNRENAIDFLDRYEQKFWDYKYKIPGY